MGLDNRDYMRPDFQSGSQHGGARLGGPRSWSVITWLIVINVAVFVLQGVDNNVLLEFGSLSWSSLKQGEIWTLITYMFLHGSIWHVAANMFVLYFAGRNVLAMLGKRNFLAIYFGGGVLGAAAQIGFGVMMGNEGPLIGASAGVFAAVFAMATLMPEQKVYLLLFFVIPIRMKMKTLGLVFLTLEVAMFILDLSGILQLGIGNLAHLGGAFFGWFYVKKGLSASGRQRPSSDESNRWLSRFGGRQVVDAEMTDSAEKKPSWFKSSKKQPYISASVDEILEKISAHGMQSLTEDERKILEKSSEKLSQMTNRADRDK